MYSSWNHSDYKYLIYALESGGCSVPDPEARQSLKKLGFMEDANVRSKYQGNVLPFGMALTKKGQQRAKQIMEDMTEQRTALKQSMNRRGRRGAAFPKSYRDPHRRLYGEAIWPVKLRYPMGVD
jgi:hypothetical protein